YLINEKPDAIINIIDGTNIERNLYLSTQIMELGIPVIMAVNMTDLLAKNGIELNTAKLSENLGCEVVEISALKGTGIKEAAEKAVKLAESKKANKIVHKFDAKVEAAIEAVEAKFGSDVASEQKRFFAIKLLESDNKINQLLTNVPDVKAEISQLESDFDDDAESIITNERYTYISSIIDECVKKAKSKDKLTTSDKIDKIVTNRILALPIFAVVMFLVYYIAMVTVGSAATDWANDGLFGDGFHLFGIGTAAYEEAADEYGDSDEIIAAYVESLGDSGETIADAIDTEADDYDSEAAVKALTTLEATVKPSSTVDYTVEDEETLETTDETADAAAIKEAIELAVKYDGAAPDPADYGVWVPGVPVLIENGLDAIGCADWLKGLILDGIVAGVGAVLGFVPQMLVLFLLLAILEACGYMARIAFIMDRIFRRFGLSGKSFIPILIGTGCGVPGIMASRTIENERDRRMTIMTTTFIPCGAKTPFIAMIAGAIFGGSAWVATSAYFIGMAAIIVSGIILKKTKLFMGDPAPFVMELPAYHIPTVGNVLRSMWERGWSFIKKAGTIILLSTIIVWFTTYFGFTDEGFRMLAEDEIDMSILAKIGGAIAWIFTPLGWGNWQAAVASITGLVAKENIVGTMGILYGGGDLSPYAALALAFSKLAGFSFLTFNLLCAPCFAAIGAIKREMNSAKWTWTAIGYQCGFAYVVSLCIYNIGMLVTGGGFSFWTIVAFVLVAGFIYLLFRPAKKGAQA
ncbi:MAG: ferrous iron transporter B, partial [[Bacteroides] pectinophilus]|nr:ferrous iron transporter B [[Bacteroides] pectinophilus]